MGKKKLTDDEIREVRRLFWGLGVRQMTIAGKFKVTQGYVSKVLAEKSRPPKN